MTSKYSSLSTFLRNSREENVELTFEEIEKKLQFNLPESAYKYRPWWSNDTTHVQAQEGWMRSGWSVTTIDMGKRVVTFKKILQQIITSENNKQSSSKDVKNFSEFENYAREQMSIMFGTELRSGKTKEVQKLFDFMSYDKTIIGDAKYFTMVRGKVNPPGKFSVIAEHVWLLEKTNAKTKFLIFGNDERVPIKWLEKYGNLVSNVDFYFLNESGKIDNLRGGENI
jgi:hypothetical protein